MPVVNAGALTYRPFTLVDADFVAGRDDDTALSAGVVGEIATAEVGDSGQLANYEAIQIGRAAQASGGDNKGNEMYVKLVSGGSDIADTADFAFAARRKGEIGGGVQGEVTGFRSHRNQDNADPRQRTSLPPQRPIIKSGRVLQLLARDETASLTVDLSESTFQIPCKGGQ